MIHKIKAPYDDGDGLSIRAIGQELDRARNTVHKYLRQNEAAIEAAQTLRARSKKLDSRRDSIAYLLYRHPHIPDEVFLRKHCGQDLA